MSDDERTYLEQLIQRVIGIAWVSLGSVIVAAFVFGGWVVSLELRAQDTSIRLSNNAKQNTEVQVELNAHDRRVMRVEDSVQSINKSLDRIEVKLGTK